MALMKSSDFVVSDKGQKGSNKQSRHDVDIHNFFLDSFFFPFSREAVSVCVSLCVYICMYIFIFFHLFVRLCVLLCIHDAPVSEQLDGALAHESCLFFLTPPLIPQVSVPAPTSGGRRKHGLPQDQTTRPRPRVLEQSPAAATACSTLCWRL